MISERPYVLHGKRFSRSASLILFWSQTAGGLSNRVIDCLDQQLKLELCGEIKQGKFFSLGGVQIKRDVIQFPQSKFYRCRASNIIIFESDVPSHNHYEFINTIIEFAQDCCRLKELVTIGEIISAIGPQEKRKMAAVVNQSKLKKALASYEIATDINFRTATGGIPTLNSFALWVAQKRDIAGYNFWIDIPFYLAATYDAAAAKKILGFLDDKFKLGLDLTGIDQDAAKLETRLAELMKQNKEAGRLMGLLTRGISVTRNEGEMLSQEVTDFLQGDY